jgi:hypothetical protein
MDTIKVGGKSKGRGATVGVERGLGKSSGDLDFAEKVEGADEKYVHVYGRQCRRRFPTKGSCKCTRSFNVD